MVNLTSEVIAFLTVEALNKMVEDAKAQGTVITHSEIIDEVIADPKGNTAVYMGKLIYAGIEGVEIAMKRQAEKDKQK